jgi:hypothetical protein
MWFTMMLAVVLASPVQMTLDLVLGTTTTVVRIEPVDGWW